MALTHSTFKIQPATSKDIASIQRIVAISWPATYGDILSPEQLNYMIDLIYSDAALINQFNQGHHFYILWEQQTAMGFIDIQTLNDTDCKLHKIYLLPGHQGKGYGKILLNFAIEKARQMGGKALKLNVNRYNKALGFYQRMGFKTILEVDIPIGQGYYMNDYVMTLPL